MTYRIAGWQTFQHYKERRPVWIKLHTALLTNRAFMTLSDHHKALLVQLWIVASDGDEGSLPSLEDVAFRLHLASLSHADLKPLIDNGFLECNGDASELLADGYQDASLEKRREESEKSREEPRRGASKPREERIPADAGGWPGTWSREACDDWTAQYEGPAPGGKIGKALKRLQGQHEWPEVRRRWRIYLAATAGAYADPHRFVATLGEWSLPPVRGGPTNGGGWDSPEVSERAREYAARFDPPPEDTLTDAELRDKLKAIREASH